jgi:hypothetical protein
MKARLILVLLSVALVSGCTSTGPADTSLNPDTLSQEEVTTYTVDTGAASAQEVRDVLEARLSDAGIPHSMDRVEGNSSDSGLLEIKVESTRNLSAQRDRIEELLEPGRFEAGLKFSASGREQLQYGEGSGSETFSIGQNQDGYVFEGETYREGEEFSFRGRRAYFDDGELNMVAYTSDGIVSAGDQRAMSGRRGVQITARLTLSQNASDHFYSLLQSYRMTEDSSYLEKTDGEPAKVHFRLDNETFQSLTMSTYLRESRTRNVQLSMSGETEEEAREKMNRIRSKIVSGKLPEGVEIVKIE